MPRVTQEMIDNCTEFKKCTNCKMEKKVVYFSKRGNGLKSWCKQCDADRAKREKEKLIKVVEKPSLYKRTIAWLFR